MHRCLGVYTYIGGRSNAVDSHPCVTEVETTDKAGGQRNFGSRGRVNDGDTSGQSAQCARNVRPGSNDRRSDHEEEGDEGKASDVTAKPENLSVGDKNDGEVLENGVDGDGEELEGLGSRVDDSDEEEGDWEPSFGICPVKVSD